MQGRGEAVIEPRVHLEPRSGAEGHFNVLRGFLGGQIGMAGVKVVGDFVGNYTLGLPSETRPALPVRPGNRGAGRGHRRQRHHRDAHRRGDRGRCQVPGPAAAAGCLATSGRAAPPTGTCGCLTGCSASTRSGCTRAGRKAATRSRARLSRELGKPVIATADWRSCVEGADIVVEASRLSAPEPLLQTEWIKPGALVVPYGTMSAVELSLTDIMSKIVVDDWGQCATGKFGALRAHVEAGKLTAGTLHAELGQIVAGLRPGRGKRPGDHPVLAPRPVPVRHRPRPCPAGQGRLARHWTTTAVRLTTSIGGRPGHSRRSLPGS